jgi:two-component system, OmpR family, response regulator
LGGADGLSMVETLRQEGFKTPVLVISALSAVDERIKGLKAGGDDYLVKPFAMAELTARIEALLRRVDDTRVSKLRVGDLEMDLIEQTVRRGEVEIDLLPREFKLLEFFLRRPGQLVTRPMLLEGVWRYRFNPNTNAVDVHIGNLRRKIDVHGRPSLITNIRGAGFMLNAGS